MLCSFSTTLLFLFLGLHFVWEEQENGFEGYIGGSFVCCIFSYTFFFVIVFFFITHLFYFDFEMNRNFSFFFFFFLLPSLYIVYFNKQRTVVHHNTVMPPALSVCPCASFLRFASHPDFTLLRTVALRAYSSAFKALFRFACCVPGCLPVCYRCSC